MHVKASIGAIGTEARKVSRECPGSLAQAPKGEQLMELGSEASAALLFAGIESDARAMRRFATRIASLRWSNHRITALVRSLAAEELGVAKLHPPAVCTDIKAWVGSGHRTLPKATELSVKRLEALGDEVGGAKGKGESLEEAVLRLLAPRESARERRVAQHIEWLEEATAGQIAHAFEAAFAGVARALGVGSS